jgi:hypothetical protein
MLALIASLVRGLFAIRSADDALGVRSVRVRRMRTPAPGFTSSLSILPILLCTGFGVFGATGSGRLAKETSAVVDALSRGDLASDEVVAHVGEAIERSRSAENDSLRLSYAAQAAVFADYVWAHGEYGRKERAKLGHETRFLCGGWIVARLSILDRCVPATAAAAIAAVLLGEVAEMQGDRFGTLRAWHESVRHATAEDSVERVALRVTRSRLFATIRRETRDGFQTFMRSTIRRHEVEFGDYPASVGDGSVSGFIEHFRGLIDDTAEVLGPQDLELLDAHLSIRSYSALSGELDLGCSFDN